MIIGFWHIALVGCVERIYAQQWLKLKHSGLYDASDKIYVNVVGHADPDRSPSIEANALGFPDTIINDPKVIFSTDPTRYVFEFSTLKIIKEVAHQSEPFLAYYIHTKGSTTANHFIPNAAYWWGQYLEHYTITRWQDNIQKLNEGHDITGVEWRTSPVPHFSGNFWWANSEYLKRLPDVQQYINTYKNDRFMAEMYVGRANPRYFCFKNTWANLYLYSCTPDQWT